MKNPFQIGLSNLRALAAVALCSIAIILSMSPTPAATSTSIPVAPSDTLGAIGYENFQAPGVLLPVTESEGGQQIHSVEYMGRNAGEPSIGSNWATDVAMFKSGFESLFVTFNDRTATSCPTGAAATWVTRSATTSITLDSDPISFTDRGWTDALGQLHSRTFGGELTFLTPDTVKLSYTDDDGMTWVPEQTGGLASAVDHETIGAGKYHDPIPQRPDGTVYPYAVYYCSQDVATALCSRSDDGGLTFGPSIAIYTLANCGGVHGHVKVSPVDGTVYVPNLDCTSTLGSDDMQAVVVSEDNGATWTIERTPVAIPGGSGVGSDPAVGIDENGRVYFLGAHHSTKAIVATSDDHGQTWQNVYDVGAVYGLKQVAFPAAVAGSAGRAAVAFFGSTTGSEGGDSNKADFKGVWHLYIAHTFDGGTHWTVTDATPNAPMQRSGLLRGGGANITRNLLDFFDMTIDKDGRVLVGYVNGCEGGPCAQAGPTATGNAYTNTATIARQSSGRRLIASKDPLSGTSAPGMPFLTQRRVGNVVHLLWSEADTGNSPITSYKIYRGTASGAEGSSPITTVTGKQIGGTFNDTTATDPTVTYYYTVTAVNQNGESCPNNEVAAPYVGDYANGIVIHKNEPSHPEANGGTLTPPELLIDYIAVGEPADKPGMLMFKMKVYDLLNIIPNSRWRMMWNSFTSPGQQYYVGMTSDSNANISFEYGTMGDAGVPGVFVIQETKTGTPGAASNYQPDGTITMYVPKSEIGNPRPGDLLGPVGGRTFTGDTPTTNTLERSNLFVDHTFVKAQADNSYPPSTYMMAPLPIQVTVKTNPAGLSFSVDGANYTTSQTFSWTPGSSHTIGTTSPQNGATGVRYGWSGWSGGGAISHTVAPTTNTTYTAGFTTQYYLTMSHGTGGTVNPTSGWRNSGSTVSLTATPAAGYKFTSWSGTGTASFSGTSNPASVTMNGPIAETAALTKSP